MKKSDLKKIIAEVLDECLAEISTSGGAGAYNTPYAFSKNGKQRLSIVRRGLPKGYTIAEDEDVSVDDAIGTEKITEARSRYGRFKESAEMKNHAKISYGLLEAKKALREVNFLVSICERLKTECNIDSTALWKRTKPDVAEICRLVTEIQKRASKL